MWIVETGVDVKSRAYTYTLVNVDQGGRELRKAGQFKAKENADKVVGILNSLNPHKANLIAGYLGIEGRLKEV